ncbi:MAG TPA: acetylxylan esterase [Verrucomicrobiae bacterium]|nr:acetylxylan esterase [Verrucomicrobiae bacterium]
MKTIAPWLVSLAFTSLSVAAATNEGQSSMLQFLKREAIRLDSKFLDGITNRQQWEAQRGRLREEYLDMLGLWPMPERTPLEAAITGVIERDEGFRVEKLHFQSRPKLYVTGNLYVPKDAKPGAKLPAVLYVCGHSGRGRDGNKAAFQHHGMWFATHGYVCLIIDTLQLGEIAAIHHGTYRYNRWWWQARGYTPAGVECWNGIRALDYLQSRPEVDPDRIAVTGISGGGAATFWIAAADERVKVAVPVSGMGDLEDYVGEKVVNGHCDCMFMINTFQWPWTYIAALIAPRPMLFENSGHDTIFPMNGNDRIRARLEKLYGFYTNRTDRLFDIGVTPGGHDDKVELRLMAYRWISRFLKGDDTPVSEPDLPKIEGKDLRAFPNELPSDELNTKIDETFVPLAAKSLPTTKSELAAWRERKLSELRRIVFHQLPDRGSATSSTPESPWLAILDESKSTDSKPAWLTRILGNVPTSTIGLPHLQDPAPYYIHRSCPLLGQTLDSLRLAEVLHSTAKGTPKLIGRGQAGAIAAYAALLRTNVAEVVLVDPPTSHREGPIFLNVLRVLDIPEALALLAPRPLTIYTSHRDAFTDTQKIYALAGGTLTFHPLP